MSYKNHLKKVGDKVIVTTTIPAECPILEFKGDIFKKETLKHGQEQILQIGPDIYLGPSGEIDDYIRHSCNPNCLIHIIGNRAILYSMYKIIEGMEVTFDYSTTCDDDYSNNCNCGEFRCRKKIENVKSLREEDLQNYNKFGAIPLYLTSKVFQRK